MKTRFLSALGAVPASMRRRLIGLLVASMFSIPANASSLVWNYTTLSVPDVRVQAAAYDRSGSDSFRQEPMAAVNRSVGHATAHLGTIEAASVGLAFDDMSFQVSSTSEISSSCDPLVYLCDLGASSYARSFFSVTDPDGIDIRLNVFWGYERSNGSGTISLGMGIQGASGYSLLGSNPINFLASAGNETRNLHLGPGDYGVGGNTGVGQSSGGPYSASAFLVGSIQVVPVPAAVWLFGSGLLGLIGFARHKARSA